MHYEGTIYRPPSEAKSLIIQATIGCSHNACSFCVMYKDKKYRARPVGEVLADIREVSLLYPGVQRVFLADGNALAMDTGALETILDELNLRFPRLERVGIYARPDDILSKTDDELRRLAKKGLRIVYLGVESGSDEILRYVRKGATAEDMVRAGRKAIEAGLILSVTIILGLGGKEHTYEHALQTAEVINKIDPHYLACLTLYIHPRAPLAQKVQRGEFIPLTPYESLDEMRRLVSSLEVSSCVFRSNHASNYLPIKGTLPHDKEAILNTIDLVLGRRNPRDLRPEWWRGL